MLEQLKQSDMYSPSKLRAKINMIFSDLFNVLARQGDNPNATNTAIYDGVSTYIARFGDYADQIERIIGDDGIDPEETGHEDALDDYADQIADL